MDDQHDSIVDHLNLLSDRMRGLLFNGNHSDITFVAENERVPAHAFVLASTNDHIRSRLSKEFIKGGKMEIILHDTPVESLKKLLSYIYTGRLSPSDLKLETIVGILKLSHDYEIGKLHDALCQYLLEIISEQNAGTIYVMARSSDIEYLSRRTLEWIDTHAEAWLSSEAISRMPADFLREILERDSLFVDEIQILEAVKRWAADRPDDKEVSSGVDTIRLTLFTKTQLLNIVKESKFIPADRLLDALAWHENHQNVEASRRVPKLPGVNLATTDRGAKVVTGKHKKFS